MTPPTLAPNNPCNYQSFVVRITSHTLRKVAWDSYQDFYTFIYVTLATCGDTRLWVWLWEWKELYEPAQFFVAAPIYFRVRRLFEPHKKCRVTRWNIKILAGHSSNITLFFYLLFSAIWKRAQHFFIAVLCEFSKSVIFFYYLEIFRWIFSFTNFFP